VSTRPKEKSEPGKVETPTGFGASIQPVINKTAKKNEIQYNLQQAFTIIYPFLNSIIKRLKILYSILAVPRKMHYPKIHFITRMTQKILLE
jgi:hypothetical protein